MLGFSLKSAEGLSCALFMTNAPYSEPELMGMAPGEFFNYSVLYFTFQNGQPLPKKYMGDNERKAKQKSQT